MDELSVITLAASLCGLLILAVPVSRERRRTLLLAGIFGLFAGGELLLLSRDVLVGALLFIAGGVLFLVRETLYGAEPEEHDPSPRSYRRHVLLLLVVAVLAVAAGLRFWRIGDVPYGIEQDEIAWTVSAAGVTYDHIADSTAVKQAKFLPVSSFQERIFFDLFGLSIESARLEVAFFSTVAVALFYFLVRQFTNGPAALIATFFLAISTLHVAAARQANVESHILFWIVLSYLLFWLAVRNRSLLLFFGTGISVVLGLWTYDTYYMTPAVIAAAMATFAALDFRRWRFHALSAVAFLLPISLVAENQFTYLDGRGGDPGYRRLRALRESLDGPIWEQSWDWLTFFGENMTDLLENLFVEQTRADFLLVRPDGPLVLGAVLPLAALGLLVVLRRPQRREHLFVLLWIALQLLAVPIMLGTTPARVVVPGILALFVLAGIGGSFVLDHVATRASGRQGVVVAGTILLLGILLVAVGTQMYFSEVQDPDDRVKRRAFVDLVAAQRDTSAHILMPDSTELDGYLYRKRSQVGFALEKPPDLRAATDRFGFVLFEDLLTELRSYTFGRRVAEPLLILLELKALDEQEGARDAVVAVRRCYSTELVHSGPYWHIIEIPGESLQRPRCRT